MGNSERGKAESLVGGERSRYFYGFICGRGGIRVGHNVPTIFTNGPKGRRWTAGMAVKLQTSHGSSN